MPKIQLAGLLTGWLHNISDSFTKQKKQVYLGATCVRNVEKRGNLLRWITLLGCISRPFYLHAFSTQSSALISLHAHKKTLNYHIRMPLLCCFCMYGDIALMCPIVFLISKTVKKYLSYVWLSLSFINWHTILTWLYIQKFHYNLFWTDAKWWALKKRNNIEMCNILWRYLIA